MRAKHAGLVAALALAAPAVSQPIQFSALLREEVGYGTNPFIQPGVTKGAALVSFSVAPKAVYQTARSQTVLSGIYNRDQYVHAYGYTDQLGVTLTRTDQVSQHLSSVLSASYASSNRAILDDPQNLQTIDPLDIGRRTYRSSGSYQLQWQASAADNLSYGVNISHLAYGGNAGLIKGLSSDYTQYGVSGSYDHAIDARTSVGAQADFSTTQSRAYPNSRSIQPAVTMKRQLTAIWSLNGHVGLVLQRTDGPIPRSSTSLGYGATACATYPQTHICASAERGSYPSGFGGLRTDSNFSVNVSHNLTVHSRVNFAANYDDSSSSAVPGLLTNIKGRSATASADYDADLTRRLSWGVGGRYQWRDTSTTASGRAVSATIHVSAKIGRI